MRSSVLKSKGFTLIELMLVLGIIAVVGVGIFMVAKKVETSRAIDQEMNRMSELTRGLDSAYANTQGYGPNLTMNTAINNGAIPMSLLTGTQVLDNQGNPITLSSTTYNGIAGGAAQIEYQAVSPGVCPVLVNNLAGRFAMISVGSTVVKASSTSPVDVNALVTACQGNPSLTFTYTGSGIDSTATGNTPGLPGGTSGTMPSPSVSAPSAAVPSSVSTKASVTELTFGPYTMTCTGHTDPTNPQACAPPAAPSPSSASGKTVQGHPSGYMNTAGVITAAPPTK